MRPAALPSGFRIGHWSDAARRTGCTAILAPEGTVGAADVRGGAPGTRETLVMAPGNLVSEVHAVLFAGGSAFGLAAAQGVCRFLRERGVGYGIGRARVPIVPAAVLFDLAVGDPGAFPDEEAGYAAASSASAGGIEEGSVGAACGATVGKLLGPARAVPGGFGVAEARFRGGAVSAAVALNAFGDVISGRGEILFGARSGDGFADSSRLLREDALAEFPAAGGNTTLVCVMTGTSFDSSSLRRVAIEAQDGIARAVRPAHTVVDGDVVFALASRGASPSLLTRLRCGEAAAEAVSEAIRRAAALGQRL